MTHQNVYGKFLRIATICFQLPIDKMTAIREEHPLSYTLTISLETDHNCQGQTS